MFSALEVPYKLVMQMKLNTFLPKKKKLEMHLTYQF